MMTKFVNKKERIRIGGEIADRLKTLGIVLELNSDADGFEVECRALDKNDEFIPITPATLDEIRGNRDCILAALQDRQAKTGRWLTLLYERNAQWQNESEYLLEPESDQ